MSLRLVIASVAILLLTIPVAAGEGERTLVIALDNVPYSTVAALSDPARGEDALFQGLGLRGPVPLISTFPSTTSVAFSGILEPLVEDRSPGYEAKFFDWTDNRIRGGGLRSYGKIQFPWREFWDWRMHGLFAKLTSGAHPVKVSIRSVRRSLEAYRASSKETYFVYYTTTDLVSHLKSPDGLEPVLRYLDEKLHELRASEKRPFRLVLLSDHGNAGGEPLQNVRKAVYRALKAAGFHRSKHLRRGNDVVFVPFGLVSAFVAFTPEGREADVAEAVGAVEGVEVCVAPWKDGWRVTSPAGSARIARRTTESGEELYSYEPLTGDPLELAGVAEELADGAGASPADFFPDASWLDATRERFYPDPIYRLVRGFDLVENQASVICGTAPSHMFGPVSTDLVSHLTVGPLRWTHGALFRQASLGFLMSDVRGWQPSGPVRFNQALPPFLEP